MLKDLARRYERELLDNILPFWMRHSPDREHGGYFTCLDRDGSVYDSRKYVWLNGRQVWTLSKLYNEAERKAEWLDAARLGAEFLRRHVFDAQGRCWFSLTREGHPAAFQRKPYAGLFVMLGFHEFAKASGEAWYHERAMGLYHDVRRWIADPALLGRPAFPAMPPLSPLADIYAVLVMALEIGDRAAAAEMLEAVPLHFDERRSVFLESAPLERSRRGEFPETRLVCVGSNFEIVWLLLDALEWHPDEGRQQMVLQALQGALEFGWDPDQGGFFYFQDIDGRPTLQLESQMKLWWVHAEAIYALVRAYEATGNPKWLSWLERADSYSFSHFSDSEYGEWFGYLNREGRPAHLLKGNNYKGCFHIPRALWLSIQALRRMESGRDSGH
jgi:N-acylglucosamine 2-epimerase